MVRRLIGAPVRARQPTRKGDAPNAAVGHLSDHAAASARLSRVRLLPFLDLLLLSDAVQRWACCETPAWSLGWDMKIETAKFRMEDRETIKLDAWPTWIDAVYESKDDYERILDHHVERLSDQQQRLYALGLNSLLVIFQAMDAAGKDGAIRHVMSGVNPQGCQVSSFKQPGPSELQHDFLWRFNQGLPERGRIGIFNRSYYEEVLIARVHPELLRTEEHVDPKLDDKHVWKQRYRSIRSLEKHLTANGTRVVKIYLHLSKGEQKKRFLDRIDDPTKNWKLSLSDIKERQFWNEYMGAYEEALSATSSSEAPWHVVPADDKRNARLIVSAIILSALEDLKMSAPKVSDERLAQLKTFRDQLLA